MEVGKKGERIRTKGNLELRAAGGKRRGKNQEEQGTSEEVMKREREAGRGERVEEVRGSRRG